MEPVQHPNSSDYFYDDDIKWSNVSTEIIAQPREDRLYVGDKLGVNQTLISENGMYEASLQKHGKLVIRERGNSDQPILTLGSGGRNGAQEIELLKNGRLTLRVNNTNSDGLNVIYHVPLVIYPKEDCSGDPHSCFVVIQDDGNLMIIKDKPNDHYSFFSAWHSKVYIK